MSITPPHKGARLPFGGGDYDEETVTVGGAYYPSTGHHLVPVSKGDRIYFYFASNSDDYFGPCFKFWPVKK